MASSLRPFPDALGRVHCQGRRLPRRLVVSACNADNLNKTPHATPQPHTTGLLLPFLAAKAAVLRHKRGALLPEETGGTRVGRGADVGADGRAFPVGGGVSVSASSTPPARYQLLVRPRPVDAATGVDETPESAFPGGEGIYVSITSVKWRTASRRLLFVLLG